MIDARNYAVSETLRDGTAVTFRAVRPDDKERIIKAFSQLEPESIYFRLFRYKSELTDEELKRVTEVDFSDVVGLVVTVGSGAEETVIASGRYVAYDAPGGGRRAEVGFVVEEDYQGRGIASRILKHLAVIARDHGIAEFEATVLPENKGMLAVFSRSGLPMTKRREDDVVSVTLALEEAKP